MNTKKTCQLRKNRPWIWFVLAATWLLQVIEDVQAGKSYIWDLLAVIAAVGLGVLLVRQNRVKKS
jgi:hypothetical protein